MQEEQNIPQKIKSKINTLTIRVLHCARVSSLSLSLYLDRNATSFLDFRSALSVVIDNSSSTASTSQTCTALLHSGILKGSSCAWLPFKKFRKIINGETDELIYAKATFSGQWTMTFNF